MIRAFKTYWLKYFQFRGRTSRANYWWVTLINFAIAVFAYLLFAFLLSNPVIDSVQTLGHSGGYLLITCGLGLVAFLFTVYRLVTFIPDLSISYRRYMDTGLSPYFFIVEPLMLFFGLWMFYGRLTMYDPNSQMPIWVVPIFLILFLADFLIKILPTDTFSKEWK